jgi:hypothetical protein
MTVQRMTRRCVKWSMTPQLRARLIEPASLALVALVPLALSTLSCARPFRFQVAQAVQQQYGCQMRDVLVEPLDTIGLRPRQTGWRATGCGLDLAYVCEPTTGTQGSRCAVLERPLAPVRKTPDSEVRFRMREQFACADVKVTKVGEQMFRADGCSRHITWSCGALPGSDGVVCGSVRTDL